MNRTRGEVLLEQAAGKILQQVAADGSRAHHQVRPLLAYLRQHLFDPDLSVQRMRRDCGVRDKSVLARFHADTGRSPWAYVVDRRMEVVAALLRQTDLKIWQIAHLTGYENVTTLGRAFFKRTRLRPRWSFS